MKILFPLIFLMLLISGCADDLCGNEVIESIESPNEEYIAYVFKRSCGATTKDSFQLSVLKKGETLQNKKGNVYISGGDFEIEWSKENELTVTYWSSDVYKKEAKFKGIRIDYVYKK